MFSQRASKTSVGCFTISTKCLLAQQNRSTMDESLLCRKILYNTLYWSHSTIMQLTCLVVILQHVVACIPTPPFHCTELYQHYSTSNSLCWQQYRYTQVQNFNTAQLFVGTTKVGKKCLSVCYHCCLVKGQCTTVWVIM